MLGVGLLIGLGLGLAIVYGFGFASTPLLGNPDAHISAEVGSAAPDFELESLSGSKVRLSDLRGKPVIVNFWATWCAPCVLEMPNFQKFYENYPDAFELLAVNSGEPVNTVENYIKNMGITFPVLLDPQDQVHELYPFRGYPTSYIIDKEGKVRFQHIGIMDEKQLDHYLSAVGAIQ